MNIFRLVKAMIY